jgi:peroxiredoxin family protein
MKMAIIATQCSHTALINLLTTVMAGAVSEISVRVLFRDEALFRLERKRAKTIVLSEIFGSEHASIRNRLGEMKLLDLPGLLQNAKSQGDVRLYACSSSMAIFKMEKKDLVDGIDDIRGMTSFLLDEVLEAQTVLCF